MKLITRFMLSVAMLFSLALTAQAQEVKTLLSQDFNTFTEGSLDAPGTTDLGGFSGKLYTDLGWGYSSSKVYEAGGCVLVADGGTLQTPRITMYSSDGTCRVQFRMKAKEDYGALFTVQLGYSTSQTVFLEDTEWHNITLYFAASSNNISIKSTVAGAFIDDVLITQSKGFVAPPVAKIPGDANGESFTASWSFNSGSATSFLLNVYSKDAQGAREYFMQNEVVKPLSAYSTTCTKAVTGLNPEKTYYYNVVAVNGEYQSDESNEVQVIRVITSLEAPVATDATNVSQTGFTANWETVDDAQYYYVNLYKTLVAEESTNVTLIDEDFAGITTGKKESVEYGILSGNLDQYTSTPGWYTENPAFAAGYLVLSPFSTPASVETPVMDLSAAGGVVEAQVTMQAGAYGSYYNTESVTAELVDYSGADAEVLATQQVALDSKDLKTYNIQFTGARANSCVRISYNGSYKVFIDDFKLVKSVQVGDVIKTLEATEEVKGTSHDFEVAVNNGATYSYGVVAAAMTVNASGNEYEIRSSESNIIIVSATTAVTDLNASEATIQAVYDLNGRKLNGLSNGINIVRMSDGTSRKVIVNE